MSATPPAPPSPPRPHRTPRNTLSRDVLIEAAMQVVATLGAGGLSMRSLGAHLDVDPTAIYRHFRNKKELMDALADDLIVGDETLPETGNAQADLRESFHQLRRSLLRHPTMAGVVSRRPPGCEAYWARADHAVRLLRATGRTEQDAANVYQTLLHFTLGHALTQARAAAAAEASGDQRPRPTPTTVSAPPARRFPDLAVVAPYLRIDVEVQFDEGLDAVLGRPPQQ